PTADDVSRLAHSMHAQYFRPALQREQSHRKAARQPLVDRPAGQLAQGRFAGQAGKDRQLGELPQMPQEDEVVKRALAEAEAGVNDDALGGDTGSFRPLNRFFQKDFYLAQDVIVMR